jgi:multidrug transporter EmrE-like cation transporter
MGLLYVALTIICTVVGQLIIKFQMAHVGPMPEGLFSKIPFFFKLMGNIWILTSLFMGYLAALSWMAAMTKLPLSYAYPFTSISVLLVFLVGVFFFKEPIHITQLLGVALIIVGIGCLGFGK